MSQVRRLRLEVKQNRLEMELLRSLVSVLREDLSVKDEQFDFLYESLKVGGDLLTTRRDPLILAIILVARTLRLDRHCSRGLI